MAKFKDPLSDEPFQFPEKLCNQLEECSPNGFCLFFIDDEGNPDVRLSFPHGMGEGAIRDFGARFFNSINQSLDIQEVQGFLDMNGGGHDPGCEHWDEDDED